jgi:hypothetical protein
VDRFGAASCQQVCERLIGTRTLVYGYIGLLRDEQERERGPTQVAPAPASARGVRPERHPHAQHANQSAPRQLTVAARGSAADAAPRSAALPDALRDMAPNVNRPVDATSRASTVSLMFAKARKHETSTQGMRELFAHLQQHPQCPDFEANYNRCSDVFKIHIDNTMRRLGQARAPLPRC